MGIDRWTSISQAALPKDVGDAVAAVNEMPCASSLLRLATILRDYAAECEPGQMIPVSSEKLLGLMELIVGTTDHVVSEEEDDLAVEEVARRINRRPSTVRGMCANGEFDLLGAGRSAYKHRNREWLIPSEAVTEYQRAQRGECGSAPTYNIDDWKRAVSPHSRRKNG